jgi:membrane protease YdiL (CAAX protease family)
MASLRLRGLRWKDVGFARPRGWGKAVLVAKAVGICMEAFELFIGQPLLARWLGKMPDLSDFADVVGNWKMFVVYLLPVWTLGVLGEEIVYRGYLMNRAAGIFRGTRAAWVLSLIVVSVAFGCGHIDQDTTGMIENVLNGLLPGCLACERNLAVPVIAHGFTDTLDLVLI